MDNEAQLAAQAIRILQQRLDEHKRLILELHLKSQDLEAAIQECQYNNSTLSAAGNSQAKQTEGGHAGSG